MLSKNQRLCSTIAIYLCCEMLYYIDTSHLDHANFYRAAERGLVTQARGSVSLSTSPVNITVVRGRIYAVGVLPHARQNKK
jgi:hypothetical protein